MRSFFLVSTVLYFAFFSNTIHAENTKVALGLMGFAPYSSIDPITGECGGLALDRTKQLFKDEAVTVEAICAAPARTYRNVELGVVDMSLNIKSTKAVKDNVTFSKLPFDSLYINFYSNTKLEGGIKTVASVRGYDYNGERERLTAAGYRFVDVPNTTDAIRLFFNRRTSYLISYEGPYLAYLKEMKAGLVTSRLPLSEIHSTHLTSVNTHYAVSKRSAKHDMLINLINNLQSKRLLEETN